MPERGIDMNFDKVFSRFQKRRKRMNKYTTYNTLCLAGIVLVVFYAIINFPGYYEGGLDTQEWVRICLVMISGICREAAHQKKGQGHMTTTLQGAQCMRSSLNRRYAQSAGPN